MPARALMSARRFSGFAGPSDHPSYWRVVSSVRKRVSVGVGPLNVTSRIGIVNPCGPRARNPPLGRFGLPITSNETSGPPASANRRFSKVAIVALDEYPNTLFVPAGND